MPIASEGSAKRDPIPEGTQQAICYAVLDLGTQPPNPHSQFQSSPKRKVMLCFEFPEERYSGVDEKTGEKWDRPRAVSAEFTLSLHDRAALKKFLTLWRGKKFTAEELKGFDLKNLLGVPAFVTIVHNDRGYEKIESAIKLPKGMVARKAENQLTCYDITDPIPDHLPKWIKEKIANSIEHQAARGETHESGHEPPPPADGDPGPSDDDSDLPF